MSAGQDTMQLGNLTYTNMNDVNSLYSEKNGYMDILNGGGKNDPFKSIMGGSGGGGGYQYGGSHGVGPGIMGTGGTLGGGSGAAPSGFTGGLGSQRPVTQYARERWNHDEAIRQAAAVANAQNSGQMQLAQLQGRIQLATAMAQIQAEREARMSLQIDNEKNRQLQLEMQRRNFGADDYQTKQQFHYQYGI